MQRSIGREILIATHNAGKLEEFAEMLRPFGIRCIGAASLGLAEPPETEDTYVGNARIKARAATLATGLPALADDSGLEVDALGGKPGVHTADWAIQPDGQRDFGKAMERTWFELQKAVTDKPHTARFRATFVMAFPDGTDVVFEGRVEGHLVWPLRGRLGHGFDPMFVPAGHTTTFGEMPPAEKNLISHRADAFRKFIRWLEQGK